MNKIIIINDKITTKIIDNNVEISLEKNKFSNLSTIRVNILKNTDLSIDFDCQEVKLEIHINVKSNVKCNIFEIKKNGFYKNSYKYNLAAKSILNIYKFHDVNKIKEFSTFDLNGVEAIVNYTLKTISKNSEKYDLMVYHNANNTRSNILNKGVNIKEGNLAFNVSGFVSNGTVNCFLDQNNRIINQTNNRCQINPNLFIEENDVVANHSAFIGAFPDEEIFYLMSRGITYKEAQKLLIKGFLLNDTKNQEIKKIINKYWR